MKLAMTGISLAVLAAGFVYGPVKVPVDEPRSPFSPKANDAPLTSAVETSDSRYPRIRPSDANKAKAENASETATPSSADRKKDEARKGIPTPSSSSPSLEEIRNAVKQGSREGVESLLAPLVRQLGELSKRLNTLEDQMARLEGDTRVLRAETMSLLREQKAQLEAVSRTISTLSAELVTTKKALSTSSYHGQEERARNEKWKVELTTLTRKVQDLGQQLDEAKKKAEAEKRRSEIQRLPDPPRVQGWTTKYVRLPCGYEIQRLLVPSTGTQVLCPQCGQTSYVR